MPVRTKYKFIGEFEVKSSGIVVSDPCYGVDVKCKGTLSPVVPGTWQGYVIEKGRERTDLIIVSKGVDYKKLLRRKCWEELDAMVCVDSGQLGFYDEQSFSQVSTEFDKIIDAEDGWKKYEANDMLMLLPYGVVSHTAYGDGYFVCMSSRNEDDLICAICVDLLGPYADIFHLGAEKAAAEEKA
jgi:hypothetical protein